MAGSLDPLEIDCDSPPYSIVQACRMVGVQKPEDVPWYRYSRYVIGQYDQGEIVRIDKWKSLLGLNRPPGTRCTCGHKLPDLERCTFTYLSGKEAVYLVGQCSRCFTIFWDET